MGDAKRRAVTVALVAVIAVGLGLLLYPSVSDWWNSTRQSRAVASYGAVVSDAGTARIARIWRDAASYNERLAEQGNTWMLTEEQLEDYESQLSVDGSGIMGYVDIPKIHCTLPIYHGTDEEVLQVAVGHIEGSSLPVGGSSSHCVISGHRGLPAARLFTDLDQLEAGDVFTLQTLDRVLAYEVDRISIVLPHEVEGIAIVEGEDLCTLVTCTPYGVNSHRLLVRGHRVAELEEDIVRVVADASLVEPRVVALCIAVPILVVLFAFAMVRGSKKKA